MKCRGDRRAFAADLKACAFCWGSVTRTVVVDDAGAIALGNAEQSDLPTFDNP
jgi:hypothetical protein